MLQSLIPQERLDEMMHLASQTPPGCFVEIGVYRGGSAECLQTIASEQNRELHLFDTFTGIPNKSEIDRHMIGDFADLDFENLKAGLPAAHFHIGIFPDTFTDAVKDKVGSIAFIHADVDQYQSQKAINEVLWPHVVKDGIMMFDDYYLLAGIKKAVDEDFPGQLHTESLRPYVVKT